MDVCCNGCGQSAVSRGDGEWDGRPEYVEFGIVFELHHVLDLGIDGVGWCDGVEKGGESIRSALLEDTHWLIAGDGCAEVDCCLVLLIDDAVNEGGADGADGAAEGDDGRFLKRICVLSVRGWRRYEWIGEGLDKTGRSSGVVYLCYYGESALK